MPDIGPVTTPTAVPPPGSDAPASRTIFVDPTAAAGGDGSFAKPYRGWGEFQLQAGDTALQRGGTVSSAFAITAQGTADRPIVIGSYGVGQAKVNGSVVLSGARNIVVDNLDITGGNSHGVVLVNGSASITVENCKIHGGVGGVLITGAPSHSNRITGNHIYENDTIGISFDGAVAARDAETLVSGNTIYRNGQQGILLHSSHVIIDANTVVNNGLAGLPGMSAIHLFGDSPADIACHENVISNNIVADQRDGSSVDGNGIMLDHFVTDTKVIGNQVFGNDGAGISLFSATDNIVLNNTLRDNMADAGGTHVINHAELFLGEASFAPGRTTGNLVANNTIVATRPNAVAVQVQATVAGTTSNIITGNALGAAAGDKLWIWGTRGGTSLAQWNTLKGTGTDIAASGAPPGPLAIDPAMLDPTFTLRSRFLRTVNPAARTMLVANATAKDVTGSLAGSWIAGDGRDNVLEGVGGDNLIAAGRGNAVLRGGPGRDTLFGGAGNNTLFAGAGDTWLIGGAGNSRLVGGSGSDIINAGNGRGAVTLEGGAGENGLIGGAGRDTFVIGYGLDYIVGFTIGQDLLDVSALRAAAFSELRINRDARGTAIADGNGVVRAVLAGLETQNLSASDFILARNDGAATIAIATPTARLAEGNAGTTNAIFAVSRTGDLARSHSVQWNVAGVTGAKTAAATAQDFVGSVLPTGTLAFAAGQASGTITVAIAGDNLLEGDESFRIALAAPSAGLTIGTASALAIIHNDDALISIAALRATRSEGQAGLTPFTFDVTRQGSSTAGVALDWAVAGGTVTGTVAANALDFAGGVLPGGQVSFAAGQTRQTITVNLVGDARAEANESFTVALSNAPAGVTLGSTSASGIVYDDEALGTGTLSITRANAVAREGDRGWTPFTFTITRSGDTTGAARADWSIVGGGVSGTAAATGADFLRGVLPSGRVAFAPGQSSQGFTINITSDTVAEQTESFTVTLSGPQSGVTLGTAAASGIIENDDDFVSKPESETLRGFDTVDVFMLGGGLDVVIGGGATDVFRFLPTAMGSATDHGTIFQDFNPAAGERLDLSRIDAVIRTAADDAFSFIGTAGFSNVAGQLRWQDDAGQRLIQADVNGDKWADISIFVTTAGPVEASWFVL